MTINVGSAAIAGVKVGSASATAVYVGATLVWSSVVALSTSPTSSVTDTGARVSFRTSAPATVAVKYSTASDLSGATTTAGVVVSSAADFTGKVDVSGLPASTTHYYTLLVNGVDQLTAPYPKFKTFPAAGSPAVFSFAFGSCTSQGNSDNIFDQVPSDAALLLHLGDTVYQSSSSTVDVKRALQRLHLAGGSHYTSFKALRNRTPVFTTWDDWDLANGFSGGVTDPIYAPSFDAFTNYSGKANPDSMTAGALYYTIQVGNVGFFVLDGRSYRNYAGQTILGATQLAALKDWLLTNNSGLKVKVICSGTPVSGYGTTGSDSWGNGYPLERNALWDYIDANQISGVVFISGDQHWAASFKKMYGATTARPRYEFGASPFSNTKNSPPASPVPDPVNGPIFWTYSADNNYGLVTVDTTVTPATVNFQLYNTTGSLGAAYSTSLTLNDIDSGLTTVPLALTGTLPGGTVGQPWTGTLAFTGDYVSPLAIDASVGTIPAWMGTPAIDYTARTVTWSGTPTTAQAYSFTPRATDAASKVAVGPAQSVVVSAAATSGPAIVPGQHVELVQSSASNVFTLPAAPTENNYLLFLTVKGHPEYAVSFDKTGWTRFSGMPHYSNSVGTDAWIRKVGAGESATNTVSFSTNFVGGMSMMEISGSTGTITGIVYDVTASGYPIALTIPAGVSGALAILVEGAYSADVSEATGISGWTTVVYAPERVSGRNCPLAVLTRDTLSDGSVISISAPGFVLASGSYDRPRAFAFLIS